VRLPYLAVSSDFIERRICGLLAASGCCPARAIREKQKDAGRSGAVGETRVDYLNLCAITLQSRRIAANNSQRIHSFGIYAIRGILCPLSAAFAKRCPLFDIGSFHKRIDGELPAGSICTNMRVHYYPLIERLDCYRRAGSDNYIRFVKNTSLSQYGRPRLLSSPA